MARIIAITNQKGGVGKTTTTFNLGVGLARMGYRVLFVDLDPQCSLSYIMNAGEGFDTALELLLGQAVVDAAIQKTPEGDLIAASPSLSGMDIVLNQAGKEYRLREALAPVQNRYDFIMVDSPPTLGILTVNILAAANQVIIPALADIFSLQGVGQLYATIEAVRTYCNPGLSISGILIVRNIERFILNRAMRDMLQETATQLGTRVFSATVREAVSLRESQANRQSIFRYAPRSKQASDYEAVVKEFLKGGRRQ